MPRLSNCRPRDGREGGPASQEAAAKSDIPGTRHILLLFPLVRPHTLLDYHSVSRCPPARQRASGQPPRTPQPIAGAICLEDEPLSCPPHPSPRQRPSPQTPVLFKEGIFNISKILEFVTVVFNPCHGCQVISFIRKPVVSRTNQHFLNKFPFSPNFLQKQT